MCISLPQHPCGSIERPTLHGNRRCKLSKRNCPRRHAPKNKIDKHTAVSGVKAKKNIKDYAIMQTSEFSILARVLHSYSTYHANSSKALLGLLGYCTYRFVRKVSVPQNTWCNQRPNIQRDTTPLGCHFDPNSNPAQIHLKALHNAASGCYKI